LFSAVCGLSLCELKESVSFLLDGLIEKFFEKVFNLGFSFFVSGCLLKAHIFSTLFHTRAFRYHRIIITVSLTLKVASKRREEEEEEDLYCCYIAILLKR